MRILTAGVLAIAATTLGGLPGTASAQSANWSGAYVTGFGGYGTGQSAQHDNGVPVMPPAIAAAGGGGMLPIPADGSYSLGGGFGGGLVGYDVQFDRYVIGAEGSIAGGGIKGNSGACGVPPHVCGTTIDAMADVRGRFGLAYGNFLPFIAAGLAVDHIKGYDSLFGVGGSAWRSGYTVGAGVEYKITPALSLRAEYLHTEIGAAHLFDIVPGVPERVSARTESIRVGVSYSFNASAAIAPVIARY